MLYFSIQNRLHDGTGKVSEAAGARWRFYPRIMFGLRSDYVRNVVESSFYWRKQFTEFPLKSWTYRFRGRRSIWWGWRLTVLAPRIVNDVSYMWRGSIMRFILRGRRSIWWGSRLTLLAPRILNDVSYVTRINHEMHFAWQAQYLVKLERDFLWQAKACLAICSFCLAYLFFPLLYFWV